MLKAFILSSCLLAAVPMGGPLGGGRQGPQPLPRPVCPVCPAPSPNPTPHPFADAVNNLAEQVEITREAQREKEQAEKILEFSLVAAVGLVGVGILAMALRRRRY